MLFSKERINIGRQPEIDLARGFSAVLIILCHVGLYLGNPADKILYTFSDIIGSEPCAPVFMALMGTSILYSRNSEPKNLLLRGIKLFLGGYLLSAYRTLLPRLIFGNIDEWTTIDSFFVIDILPFAGLTFMFLALLKKLKIPSVGIFALSIAMVGAGQYFIMNPPLIENVYTASFVNLFLPVTEWSCFPFLTWFFFPAFGLLFGEALQRCRNKKKFYGIILPISLCGTAYIYYRFYRLYPDYALNYYYGGNFYYMGIKNVLLTAVFIMFCLSVWYFADKILPEIIKKPLTFLGRNLNVFYVFTWIFISMLIHINVLNGILYDGKTAAAVMLVLTVVCYWCSKAVVGIKKKIKTKSVPAVK